MVGERIGNYKVIRKIGDGGMGSVFEAVHESIGRRAAVKILHAKYSRDQTIVARFFNEARAVNIVQHPGIVGIFDYGTLPDGTAYIIMEYLEGEALNSRIKRLGRLGPDALRITRQIAGTLAAAHSKNIIHRDLKPDNIIVVADPEAPGGERAKVLDFGIAKITREASEQADQGMTQTGMVMGTPKYMSPEQCRGTGQVDAKADVYSLGVMLFEMYCGVLPFVAEGTGALLAMHIYKPPPRLAEYDPMVMPQLEELVQAMLAKEASQRPSMVEVVQRLESFGIKGTQALPVFGGMSSQSLSMPGLPVAAPGQGQSSPGFPPPGQSSPGFAAAKSQPTGNTLLAGQAENPTGVGAQRQLLQRLLIPVGAALAVFIGAIVVFKGQRASQPVAISMAPPTAPAPAKVVWSLKSEPAGAQVVRTSDGTILGTTPWRMEQPAGQGKLEVALRRDGYVEKRLALDLGKDTTEAVALEVTPAPDPAKPTAQAKPAGASRPAAVLKPVPPRPGRPLLRPTIRPGKPKPKENKKDDDFIAPVR